MNSTENQPSKAETPEMQNVNMLAGNQKMMNLKLKINTILKVNYNSNLTFINVAVPKVLA